jgi:hypothetical protein
LRSFWIVFFAVRLAAPLAKKRRTIVMSHTEQRARELWCPMARYAQEDTVSANRRQGKQGYVNNPESCRCLASECAMARWDNEKRKTGYCGLAGAPTDE